MRPSLRSKTNGIVRLDVFRSESRAPRRGCTRLRDRPGCHTRYIPSDLAVLESPVLVRDCDKGMFE